MLEIRDLCVNRGGKSVLSGIDLVLRAGDLVELRGDNGAGKTTLLRAIAGLCPSSLRVNSTQIHYIGHQKGIKSKLTPLEHMNYWLRLNGQSYCDVRARETLAVCGLEHLLSVPMLYSSQGQKCRLGFARLLLIDRPIWLLDEPQASLDTGGIQMLTGMLQKHRGKGGSVIMALHGDSLCPPNQTLWLS